jgi:hypothetical protein
MSNRLKAWNRFCQVAVSLPPCSSRHIENIVTPTAAIRRERDRAEGELAIIKQECLLQNLVIAGEPTAAAIAQLARLHEILTRLAAPADGAHDA